MGLGARRCVVRGGASLCGGGFLGGVRWVAALPGCVAGVGLLCGLCVAVVKCSMFLARSAGFVGFWALGLGMLASGVAVGLV